MSEPHVYKVEGIGEDMICGAMDLSVMDDVRQVNDAQAFAMARRLAREEGIFAGGSSGAAVHVAAQLAREMGAGKTIVVILPDGGRAYISKFFSDEWMQDNGFARRGSAAPIDRPRRPRRPVAARSSPPKAGETVETVVRRCASTTSRRCRSPTRRARRSAWSTSRTCSPSCSTGEHRSAELVEPVMAQLDGVVWLDMSVDALGAIFADDKVAVVVDEGGIVRHRRQDRRHRLPRPREGSKERLVKPLPPDEEARLAFETRAIHAGSAPTRRPGAVMTPVYLTSTYVQDGPGVHKGFEYSRTHNPTRDALEGCLASLEGAKHGLAFASGLAATDCLMHLLDAGDHVVDSDDVYGGTFRLFDKVFRRLGLEFTRRGHDRRPRTSSGRSARTPRLVWIETPTNPMLKLADIAAVAAIAKAKGVLHRRGQHVRDAVLPAAARARRRRRAPLDDQVPERPQRRRRRRRPDERRARSHERLRFLQNAVGAVPGPLDCFLVLRGLKTLPVRMERHAANAARIAAHPRGAPEGRAGRLPGPRVASAARARASGRCGASAAC